MTVNRCICRSHLFLEGLQIARLHGCVNVAEVQRHMDIGTGCGLCIPYFQAVIETGQTEIPLLNEMERIKYTRRSGIDESQ